MDQREALNVNWTVRFRFAVLILLAAATALYRGQDLEHVFLSDAGPRVPGFGWVVQNGAMTVTFVPKQEISGDPSPIFRAGLQVGDRVIAVRNARGESQIIGGLFDFGESIRGIGPKDPSHMVVFRQSPSGDGRFVDLTIPPRSEDLQRDVRYRVLVLMFYVLLPFAAIITAFFIGFMRLDNANAFAASLLFLSFSTIFESNLFSFRPGLREFSLLYHVTLNSFLTYLFLRFFLLFPSPSWIDRKLPWLKSAAAVATILFWAAALTFTFAQAYDFAYFQRVTALVPGADVVSTLLLISMFLLGLASLVLNTAGAESKDERRRMTILLIGTLAGLLPLAFFIAYLSIASPSIPPWWLFGLVGATLGLFPVSFFYVVVRHRVLGIRLIVRRGLQYALVSRAFLAVEGVLIFALFYFGAGPVLFRLLPDAGPVTVALIDGVTTVVALLLLRGLNRRVMPVIDRRFFRDPYDAQSILAELTRTIRRLVTHPEKLLGTVSQTTMAALHPRRVAIFLRGGDVLATLPKGPYSSVHGLARFNPRESRSFQLYQSRSQDEPAGPDGVPVLPASHELALSADSFIGRELRKSVGQEPEALDVYLDDLKAWSAPLSLVSPRDAGLYQERQLLDLLRTRLLVPIATHDQLLGFISLGEKLSEEPYSREDKGLLLAIAEQTAIALDYSHLVGQVAEQEILRRDIEIAKQVQAQLFPQARPIFSTLDYSAVCKPAREVGGDYYDFLQLSDSQLCLAVGDISGKGLSASLLMASLQALMRSQAPLRGQSPALLLSDINRLMCSSTDGSKYATFFCGMYEQLTRRFTYVNAGHNLPILLKGATVGNGGRRRINRLFTGGTVVGLFPDAFYEQETIDLNPGDLLIVYTDGATEAFNTEMEEFGEERLIEAVKNVACLPSEAICEAVLHEVEKFVGSAPRHDDLTLLVAKIVE